MGERVNVSARFVGIYKLNILSLSFLPSSSTCAGFTESIIACSCFSKVNISGFFFLL